MKVSKKNYNKLCEIARELSDYDEPSIQELWYKIEDVIESIED